MDPNSRAPEHPAAADPEKDLGRTDAMEEERASIKGKDFIENGGAPLTVDPAVIRSDPVWQAKEKALVRRLDITFMPLLWILYFHNYLDRNNIA
jgi:hypothetical protein